MDRPRTVWMLALAWLIVVVAGAMLVPNWGDPLRLNLAERLAPPGQSHWFGTDELGRDVMIRLFYAARFTLWVMVCATALSLSLGFLFGSTAGWFGRWVDTVVVWLINLFWTVPFIVFAVLLIAIVGANATTLILAIGIVNSVPSARVFRTETLRLRRSEFLTNARALGFGPFQIFYLHLLPNLRAAWVGMAGYGAAETVTWESGLAFLGLSLPPPSPTWGGMMADGLQQFSTAWWIAGVPAVAVTLTLLSFRVLADTFAARDIAP